MAQTDLVELNYNEANNFVNKNNELGFFWNGWNIYKWTANDNGFMQKNGMYRNGQWGHAMKIPMTDKGTWMVLKKYV